MAHTVQTVNDRGALLHMAPEGVPPEAADVFALGVTLCTLLECDCNESRAPTAGSGAGPDIQTLLARLTAGGGGNGPEVAQLLIRMMAPAAAARPAAVEVETGLRELAEAKFTRRLRDLNDTAAAQAAAQARLDQLSCSRE